jgi:hypothetical protein
MAALNQFQLALRGTRWPDGTGTTKAATFWMLGVKHQPRMGGTGLEASNGADNDSGLFSQAYKLVFVPFGYKAGEMGGNDHASYIELTDILQMQYKAITAFTGLDLIGSDGTTQWWTQQLAGGAIPIRIDSIDVNHPDDGTIVVTIDVVARRFGL